MYYSVAPTHLKGHDGPQHETSKRRKTDSSKRLYCCNPTCLVRLQNGSRGRRVELGFNLIRMSEPIYSHLRDAGSPEFAYEPQDIICVKCHVNVSPCEAK